MKKDNNMLLFEKNLQDGVLSKSAYENILNDCYKKNEKVSSVRSNNGKEKISVIIPTHNRFQNNQTNVQIVYLVKAIKMQK